MLCTLIVAEGNGIERINEPVSLGLPLPRGVLTDPCRLMLTDPRSERSWPLQVKALDYWADGSVKWVFLDFQATVGAWKAVEYQLGLAPRAQSTLGPHISLRQGEEAWTVDTEVARFVLQTRRFNLVEEVVGGGVESAEAIGSQIVLTDVSGQAYEPQIDRIEVEDPGPLRLSLALYGKLSAPGRQPLANILVRLSFYAGSGTVEMKLTVHNPRSAKHVGGLWDLGDPGSIQFRELFLCMVLDAERAAAMWAVQPEEPLTAIQNAAVTIYQDSSGGENWQSNNHVNAAGQVMRRFQGYHVQVGETVIASGKRASPTILVYDPQDGRSIAGAVEEFWQNFPKVLEASGNRLTIGLFPQQYGDVYELQGGEQKTHTLYLAFSRHWHQPTGLSWVHDRLVSHAPPQWYAESKAVNSLTPEVDDDNHDCLALINTAIAGPNSFFDRREIIDEYGWRHFGDLYADHEAVGQPGPLPRISHYNNQYDAIYGMLIQYLRTGDMRWFHLMRNLARHVIDIDIYHTTEDRPDYNGGLFWHTDHYIDAATATHRSYSRAHQHLRGGRLYGGGPANEHNYTTGLLYYFYLTGDPTARAAICSLANWVIAMDLGWRRLLRWLDRRPTGRASATASWHYHGPGRGSGNSINALVDAYLLTHEPRYLTAAEGLIRRCIHPADDIQARQLENLEQRWSYTVFLQALGKYLDVKIELNTLDFMYGYARASLLHYACWMLEHEVPYATVLDRVEIPTETWPAQDIRKVNVFDFAAKHADEPLHTAFRQKAEFFFQACIRDLHTFDTRTLTRPLVLLMSNAFRHTYFQHHPDERAPCPDQSHDYGKPENFTPQLAEIYRAKAWLAALATMGKHFGRYLTLPFGKG